MVTNILLGCIAVLILCVGILAFIINSKNKKTEKQEQEKTQLEKQLADAKAQSDIQKTVSDNYIKEMEQNEELKNNSKSDNLAGFNANISRMQNLSKN